MIDTVVTVTLVVMFVLGMLTQALLEKGDVWTNLRAWWHAR